MDLQRQSPAEIVERFGALAEAGAQHVVFSVRDVSDPASLEVIGREVVPQLRGIAAS